MSLQVTTGVGSFVSIAISLGDVAVLLNRGRRFGNWLRTAGLDEELFASLTEVPSSLLKRRGLVDVTRMKSRWSQVDFIYQGNNINDSSPNPAQPLRDTQDLSEFSWLMITVIAALDLCLPPTSIHKFLVDLFVQVPNGDQALGDSLRVQLRTNIESWKSAAQVRRMGKTISKCHSKVSLSIDA